jgi:hypothetical protein
MWTKSSVERARLKLFVSYDIALGPFNFAAGSLSRASITSSRGGQDRQRK